MRYFLVSTFSILFAFMLFSCEDSDNFSADPNLKIEFSNDTIRFDTVFTSFGSATKKLKVYNRNDNSFNIQSIKIMNPESSGFRMNVDGIAGNSVENIELLRKDSIFIFVEVTVDPLNSNSPMLIRDSIQFNINGSIQYAYLEAIGQDVELWMGGRTITQDTTIRFEKPILIYDSIYVKKGATLNIEKDVKLYFHNNAKVVVDGTINARGTIDQPIIFRGDRMDNLFTLVPYDRVPGQWQGIFVDSLSFNNYFENVHIRNMSGGIVFKRSNPNTLKATFVNTKVHNSTSDGIFAEECWIEGRNSLFTNSVGYTLNLVGGQYEFTHCTVANHFSWRSMFRQGKALMLSNTVNDSDGELSPRPLTQANFLNCIISGSSANEYTLNEKNVTFSYFFKNSVIRAREIESSAFLNVIFKDPKLKKTSAMQEGTTNKYDYLFNFELDSISPAIGIGDASISSTIPFDIRGVSRLQDGYSDAGCYEWINSQY